jgi:arylsulfatase A-like enzyme
MRRSDYPLIAWFVAAGSGAALLDVGQVSLATGGEPILRLAAMVVTLYLAMGLLAGLLLVPVCRRRWDGSARVAAGLLAGAVLGAGLLFGVVYVNIVHLPSITEPITLAANLALLLGAVACWLLARRSSVIARVAVTGPAAIAVTVLLLIASFVVASGDDPGSTAAVEAADSDLPDVFVIVIDTLRHDRSGAAAVNKSAVATPVLADLAARGLTFNRAYVQASWTKPSVASLFTSLYPATHRANLRRDRLDASLPTLPSLLAERGYNTAVFSANPWISPAFGFERGVRHFYESESETFARLVMMLRLLKMTDRVLPGKPLAAGLRTMEHAYGLATERRSNCERDSAVADEFDRWLGSADEGPVFAYFHLMSPHLPYLPPGVEHDFPADEQVALLLETEALPADRLALLLELYDGTVAHGDRVLGRLLASIRSAGREEGAMIIVTADHGEEFHEHGRWGHGKSLYDEVARVPLLLVAPGVAPATVNNDATMLVDVLPTVAAATGIAGDPRWQGRDLRVVGHAGQSGGDRAAYAELLREGGFATYMLYRDGRKYLESSSGVGEETVVEFYDLRNDAGESRNLGVSGSVGVDASEAWSAELAELRRLANSERVAGDKTDLDPASVERLKALGYLN